VILATAIEFRHAAAMSLRSLHIVLLGLLIAASVQAAAAAQRANSRAVVYRHVSMLAELGRRLFFDPTLSASGKLSCASCHDPAHAYGPPDARPVVPGGTDMRQMGLRAVPSLKYLQATPQFTEHYYDSDDEGDASIDNGPTGGLTWDGRVDRGRDQARLPLLSPLEMANDSPAAVVAQVRKSASASLLRQAFGASIFDDNEKAFDGIVQALEAYEQRYTEFYPYSSKYDDYLARQGKADGAGGARPRALQRSRQGQLRPLPYQRAGSRWHAAAIHRLRPGGSGRAPEHGNSGQRRSVVP